MEKKIATPQGSQNEALDLKVNTVGNGLPVASDIAATVIRGEPRVDTRPLAIQLGVGHKNVLAQIEKYQLHFESHGTFAFETRKSAGRPERYALLNEDQVYFLLSLSRNTDQVVLLKSRLVHAFREARDRMELASDYLPGYHALHDEVMVLAQIAMDHGSLAGDNVFHCNTNKLVNKAAGIGPGMRGNLTDGQRLMVMNLQAVIRSSLRRAIDAGADHRESYRQAKAAAMRFSEDAGYLLGGT